MQQKLTISIDKEIYDGLHSVIGRGNISQFIETLVRPHVMSSDIDQAYALLAKAESGDEEFSIWESETIADALDSSSV